MRYGEELDVQHSSQHLQRLEDTIRQIDLYLSHDGELPGCTSSVITYYPETVSREWTFARLNST